MVEAKAANITEKRRWKIKRSSTEKERLTEELRLASI